MKVESVEFVVFRFNVVPSNNLACSETEIKFEACELTGFVEAFVAAKQPPLKLIGFEGSLSRWGN